MDKVLKIKKQLSFEQFEKLIKESLGKGVDLMDLLERFDNYEGKYKVGTVYKSLQTWMQSKTK